jgi:glycerol-3-phosphate dehydrogenase
MADILKECLGEERSYAFLSGPSFAREICEGVATAVVVASEDLLLAKDIAELLSDDSFRVFTSKDVIGIEVGGAVKNVIALAAGMCEGLGLGTNAMSGLVTRGCGEMRRLGVYFGARPSTIAGLSGEYRY